MWIKTNQFGFSLIEVMVAGALVAGLGLLGARIFSQQSEQVKLVETQELLNTYHDNLRTLLTDEYNCNAMLAGSGPVSSINVNPTTFTEINICCPGGPSTNPRCEVAIGSQSCRDPLSITSMNKSAILSKVAPNNFTDNTRKIRVDDIRFYDPDPGARAYVTSLTGTSDKMYEMHLNYTLMHIQGGVASVRKIIPLALRFNDKGIFKGCTTERSASNLTSLKEMCLSLNGVIRTDGSPGTELTNWVENADGTGRCVSSDTRLSHNCPSGQVLVGIKSTGAPICRTTVEWTNPADMLGGGSCTSGTTLRLVHDTATNKIRLECN